MCVCVCVKKGDVFVPGWCLLVPCVRASSMPSVIFPIVDMVAACHKRGVRVMVDGAHAPGQLPLNVAAVGADWYTGNLHKWSFTSKVWRPQLGACLAFGCVRVREEERGPRGMQCVRRSHLCCPCCAVALQGVAFLYAREDRQEGLNPVVASHFHLRSYQERFYMQGTIDYSGFCAVPAALAFVKSIGGFEAVRKYNFGLVIWASYVRTCNGMEDGA